VPQEKNKRQTDFNGENEQDGDPPLPLRKHTRIMTELTETRQRAPVLAEPRWLGTWFDDHGHKGVGVDCLWFVVLLSVGGSVRRRGERHAAVVFYWGVGFYCHAPNDAGTASIQRRIDAHPVGCDFLSRFLQTDHSRACLLVQIVLDSVFFVESWHWLRRFGPEVAFRVRSS
jgi:hypothetical protein